MPKAIPAPSQKNKPFSLTNKSLRTIRAISPKDLLKHKLTAHQTRVYVLTQAIPPGFVTTYGAAAKVLGSSPRAVGQALRNNPFAPTVPCHRVVAQNGMKGGFSGRICGQRMVDKFNLLKAEGVKFVSTDEDWIVDGSCILDEQGLLAALAKWTREHSSST